MEGQAHLALVEGTATETSIRLRFDLSHLREPGREVPVQGGAEGRHSVGQTGGGWCLASLIDSVSPPVPPPQPWPPDILTEDDVYCSCLAKTLCHVPVPVTVGFYAPFGCRLHMMLDKITGEDPRVLGVGGQETLPSPMPPQDLLAP